MSKEQVGATKNCHQQKYLLFAYDTLIPKSKYQAIIRNMSININKESIKKYLQDNGYTQIIFSPKGHEETWGIFAVLPNRQDFQPGEELPHDNFVTIDGYLKEIKERDNDFLTELFKWARQEKVKRIEVGEQWEIVIHKKTQQDYQRDEAAKSWRVNKVINSRAKTCPYCNKQLGVDGRLKNFDSDKKIRLQHWESCFSCPEEVRTLAKKKLGELPAPQVDEGTEFFRLSDLIRNSKDLEELEENWKTVKNSSLYDNKKWTIKSMVVSNKRHFDNLYDTYKGSLKSKNNNNDNSHRERERERERESKFDNYGTELLNWRQLLTEQPSKKENYKTKGGN